MTARRKLVLLITATVVFALGCLASLDVVGIHNTAAMLFLGLALFAASGL